MIIVFDLDYTLLNTKKFKSDMAKAMGISLAVFKKSYEEHSKNSATNYILEDHLDYLVKTGKYEASQKKIIKKKVMNFLKKIDNYLFSSAAPVLAELSARGHKLEMITYGNRRWQRLKVGNLKIKKYFQRVIITDKNKHDQLRFWKKKEANVCFVNDNAKEVVCIREILPRAQFILIKGPYAFNHPHNFKVYNLKDCLKIIK
ncbi:MAG: HAD hydrolase-like protein [Patescibacteria group bacterium]|nr:HAD hydrolase-like protein [Patescibacteria group bacterium]MDD4610928.1 HAD hydrolase-like protein [Patescibacteria group bacterium]